MERERATPGCGSERITSEKDNRVMTKRTKGTATLEESLGRRSEVAYTRTPEVEASCRRFLLVTVGKNADQALRRTSD